MGDAGAVSAYREILNRCQEHVPVSGGARPGGHVASSPASIDSLTPQEGTNQNVQIGLWMRFQSD